MKLGTQRLEAKVSCGERIGYNNMAIKNLAILSTYMFYLCYSHIISL